MEWDESDAGKFIDKAEKVIGLEASNGDKLKVLEELYMKQILVGAEAGKRLVRLRKGVR